MRYYNLYREIVDCLISVEEVQDFPSLRYFSLKQIILFSVRAIFDPLNCLNIQNLPKRRSRVEGDQKLNLPLNIVLKLQDIKALSIFLLKNPSTLHSLDGDSSTLLIQRLREIPNLVCLVKLNTIVPISFEKILSNNLEAIILFLEVITANYKDEFLRASKP